MKTRSVCADAGHLTNGTGRPYRSPTKAKPQCRRLHCSFRICEVLAYAMLMLASNSGYCDNETQRTAASRPTARAGSRLEYWRRIPTHGAGALLGKTQLYDIHEYTNPNEEQSWCRNGGAYISLVFKVDDNYIISDNDAYRHRFEKDVVPLVKSRCDGVRHLNVQNYIKGAKVDMGYKVHSEDAVLDTAEFSLLSLNGEILPSGEVKFSRIGNATFSLAGLKGSGGDATRKSAAPDPEPAGSSSGRVGSAGDSQSEGKSSRGALSVNGLHYENAISNLYGGDFLNVEFDREDPYFIDMYWAYMASYSEKCGAYLPKNKVRMMRQVCRRREYPVDIYGRRQGATTCTLFKQEFTGGYADPEMHKVHEELTTHFQRNSIGEVIRMGKKLNNDLLGASGRMAKKSMDLPSDMEALVKQNKCAGAALKQFEANLMRFAQGKQATNASGLSAKASASPNLTDIDFTHLLDDLVAANADRWVVNRYKKGSMRDVSVTRDPKGKPTKVYGDYAYVGMDGLAHGSVTLTLTDGLPECLYFFDMQNDCRTPNRRIVAAFQSGSYRQ